MDEDVLLKLASAAGQLKRTRRRGWLVKAKIVHGESVADHVFRVALLAMVYADLERLDSSKIVKMALLHDLPEATLGDLTPEEKTIDVQSEAKAFKELVSNLPSKARSEYEMLWRESAEGRSREARVLRDLDRVEMALQAVEYTRMGFNTSILEEFLVSAESKVRDRRLKGLLKTVRRMFCQR